MSQSSQPRWLFWVLGGCLLVILLGVAGVVGVYYWGKNRLTALVEEQTDPVKREQNFREMLGAQKLPPGYHAGVNISLGLARLAWLSDKPVGDDNPRYNERGFIFGDSMRAGDEETDMEKFLAGNSGNVIEKMGVRIRSDEILGAGALQVNGQQLQYYARRGEVAQEKQAVPGIYSVTTIRCSDDRERWAVWFQRVPPATPTAEIPRAGSVVEESAIRDLFSHFRICR
jgi:hypothetical protein